MYNLNGRVGVVTGAGGGIGREIARRLTREGMAVAVLDRDSAAAEAVAAEIGGLALAADVTSHEQVSCAVDKVLARLQRQRLSGSSGSASTRARTAGRDSRRQQPGSHDRDRRACAVPHLRVPPVG